MSPRQKFPRCTLTTANGAFALVTVLLFAASLVSAQASASEYSFTISGSQTWTDTGVDLAAGDTLSFSSEPKNGGCSAATNGGKLPLTTAPTGTLIAKTFEKGDPMSTGTSLHLDNPGHLFLGINSAGQSGCALAVKLTIAHAEASKAAPAEQVGMKQKVSTAAQTWLKGQLGESGGQGSGSNAISPSGSPSSAALPASAPGLNLPTVILDSELKKNIDGLPRRVHDAHGNLGDMVNFVILGSQEDVQAALAAADWHVADVDSKEAGLKAILNTYQKKDYVEMPMSHLYLWDRMQDFGYEQAQAFSVVATRHHFRIWKAPFTYKNEVVWVGAATHDTGFEKDVRTGKLTHKIDPNVDAERENLADGLQKTGKVKTITYYLPTDPVQEAKNASGGSYHSDGRLLVVFLK